MNVLGQLIAPANASLTEWATHWWTWIAPLSVQLAALALPLWLLDRLWARSGRLRLRALLWSAVLLRVIWPGELGVLRWDAASAAAVPGAGTPTNAAIQGSAEWLPALALLWVLGALLGGALHLRRCQRVRRDWGIGRALEHRQISHDALRAELRALATRLGLRHLPRVRLHAALAHPLVDGVWRPTLRLPSNFVERSTPRAREHILLHELAHLRRRDPLRAAAQALLAQLLWFHPVARLALRRLHTLREQACDELAARHAQGGRVAYRRTLLEEAARTLLPERAQPGLALLGSRAPLIERLERLGRGPAQASRAALPLLAAVGVALLPVRAAERAAPLAAPSPTKLAEPAPVPGAAVGCFDTRMLVMAEFARQQAREAAHELPVAHAAPVAPNTPSPQDAEP